MHSKPWELHYNATFPDLRLLTMRVAYPATAVSQEADDSLLFIRLGERR